MMQLIDWERNRVAFDDSWHSSILNSSRILRTSSHQKRSSPHWAATEPRRSLIRSWSFIEAQHEANHRSYFPFSLRLEAKYFVNWLLKGDSSLNDSTKDFDRYSMCSEISWIDRKIWQIFISLRRQNDCIKDLANKLL